MLKTNKTGIELIKKWEGLRLKAYQCGADKWTIGWGNRYYENGKAVQPGDEITLQRAEQLFQFILRSFEINLSEILRKHNVPELTENQFAALACFIYNIGEEQFLTSTMLKKLSNGDFLGASNEFPRWNRIKGKPDKGLTRRRKEERELFLS